VREERAGSVVYGFCSVVLLFIHVSRHSLRVQILIVHALNIMLSNSVRHLLVVCCVYCRCMYFI